MRRPRVAHWDTNPSTSHHDEQHLHKHHRLLPPGIDVETTMAGSSPLPHKPRRKGKKPGSATEKPLRTRVANATLVQAPSFPLAAFLWPARRSSSQWEVLPLVLMVVGLFRWSAGLWGYSGKPSPAIHLNTSSG